MNDLPEDDYKLTPCGPLLGRVAVSQYNDFLGDFAETADALAFVKEHMDENQFWPGIWWISDHGNAWPIDLEGNELPMDEDEDTAE